MFVGQRGQTACDKPAGPPKSRQKATSQISSNVIGIQNGAAAEDTTEPKFQRCWELEQDSEQITDVQDWLKAHIKFWEDVLKAPLAILECISEGYKLPLLSIPPQYARRNQRSALLNESFVSSAITDLLANCCIQRRACEIKVTADMPKISLAHSKTDQFRLGNEVLIAGTHEDTCPVRMLEHYVSRAGIAADSEGYIIMVRGYTQMECFVILQ